MKTITNLLTLSLILLLCLSVKAQPWLQPKYLKAKTDSNGAFNFYDIQKAFQLYEKKFDAKNHENEDEEMKDGEGEDEGKFPGYNQFKRWEWFNEQRVYPSGVFPSTEMMLKEYDKFIQANNTRSGDNVASANWTNLASPTVPFGSTTGAGRINCLAFMPGNANILFVGTACGGVWKSINGGTSWTVLNTDNLPSLSISSIAIDPINTNNIYIATGDCFAGIPNFFKTLQGHFSAGVYKSVDGGQNWIATGLSYTQSQLIYPQQLIVDPITPTTLMLTTSTGIWRNTNSGMGVWSNPMAGRFYSIEFNPLNHNVVFATNGQGLWRSNNNGVTWAYRGGGYPQQIDSRVSLGVTPADTSYIYLWGPTAGFKKFTNGGNVLSYTTMTNPDGTTNPYGYYDRALAVSQTNKLEVQVGGNSSAFTLNGGSTWNPSSQYTNYLGVNYIHQDVKRIVYAPGSGTTLYALTDGGLFVTYNDGTNWTRISNGLQIGEVYRVASSPFSKDSIYFGMQDNASNLFDGTTNTVKQIVSADGMLPMVDYTTSRIVFACKQSGNLQKSTDNGLNFVLASPGQCPWVASYVMNPLNHNTMYMGTQIGVQKTWVQAVFLSWFNTSNGIIDSVLAVAVTKADTNYVYAAALRQMARSIDGAQNWTDITGTLPVYTNMLTSSGITYVAVSSTNKLEVWVTLSGYAAGNKVFKSMDGGNNWTNVSGTLPNVPVNSIVLVNGSTVDAAYIATNFGVFYTDNTMNDWMAFNTGLPNVIVNHLDIYYPTHKLRAATYGRGLWETDMIPFVALPVNLLSFSGTNNPSANTNDLVWETASELNTDYFDMMKSDDDKHFTSIGRVKAAGNATETSSYNFSDRNDIEGIHYYYLKQVDADGTVTKSKTISIDNNKESLITVFPNPAKDEIGIMNYELPIANVRIIDIFGREVLNESVSIQHPKFNIQNLSAGLYFIEVKTENGTMKGKFVKE